MAANTEAGDVPTYETTFQRQISTLFADKFSHETSNTSERSVYNKLSNVQDTATSAANLPFVPARDIGADILNNAAGVWLNWLSATWSFVTLSKWPRWTTLILDEETVIKLETDLLRRESVYFGKALSTGSNYLESREGTFWLHGIKPDHLAAFSFWLKNRRLRDKASSPFNSFPFSTEETEQELPDDCSFCGAPALPEWATGNSNEIFSTSLDVKLEQLVECYLLGAYFQAPGFQNAVTDAIVDHYMDLHYYEDWVLLHNLYNINESTTPKDPLRRLTVDMIYRCLSDDTRALAKKLKIIPRDILSEVDAVAATARSNPHAGPFIRSSWPYHVHRKGAHNSPCSERWCSNNL